MMNAELVKISKVFFVDGNHEGSVKGEKPELVFSQNGTVRKN